jgi:hypothetical protein
MTNCVKELPLIEVDIKDDLVVNGLLKANEPISVSVTRQIPIASTGNTPPDSGLTVILTQNNEIIDTMLYIDSRYYSALKAIPGRQYTLTVQTSDTEEMHAQTTVPEAVFDLKCEFTAGRVFDEYGEVVTEGFIRFKDDPARDDYYLLYIGRFYKNRFDIINYWSYWQLNDPLLVNEGILDYNPSYFVFSDEIIQGENYTLHLSYKAGYRWNGAVYTPHEAFCVLQKISVEYYLFLKSLIRHQYNQQYVDHSRLDPMELLLKGPPSEIYTNIENGKGIFGSYSETMEEFKYIPPTKF